MLIVSKIREYCQKHANLFIESDQSILIVNIRFSYTTEMFTPRIKFTMSKNAITSKEDFLIFRVTMETWDNRKIREINDICIPIFGGLDIHIQPGVIKDFGIFQLLICLPNVQSAFGDLTFTIEIVRMTACWKRLGAATVHLLHFSIVFSIIHIPQAQTDQTFVSKELGIGMGPRLSSKLIHFGPETTEILAEGAEES